MQLLLRLVKLEEAFAHKTPEGFTHGDWADRAIFLAQQDEVRGAQDRGRSARETLLYAQLG
jgi:hypothetical protein